MINVGNLAVVGVGGYVGFWADVGANLTGLSPCQVRAVYVGNVHRSVDV